MRRESVVQVICASLILALGAACGGSKSVTGDDAVATGSALLQGVALGAGEGVRVSALGTPATAELDDDGVFFLANLPAGSVTLRFEGGGANATVAVNGLQDGLVATVEVKLSGASAEVTAPVNCGPTADVFFSGLIERISGTSLVIAGRSVDASQVKKVWRGERRIQLNELQAGEKVKVWGTLRADGAVLAEEIAALTTGTGGDSETWVSFKGLVESVSSSSDGASDFHANPNVTTYPAVRVAGRVVRTSESTKFTWTDGNKLDPKDIKPGQTALVEGWKKADGTIRATSFAIEGSSPAGTKVSFKGTVEGLAVLDRGTIGVLPSSVHASCILKMTVAGRKVETDGSTAYKWSDGSSLDPYAVKVGDKATIEGWTQSSGVVLAAKMVVDKR